jgi:cell division protein FtsQ
MARVVWRTWVSAAGWSAVCVSAALGANALQHFLYTDPLFLLSWRRDAIAVEGLRYASRARVEHVFAPDRGRSILGMPLAERRRRLLGIDWVEDAAVSRIWPRQVHVRIRERVPVAFVNLPLAAFVRGARVALIDAQGVLLEPPPQAKFTFPVLGGVTEQQSEAQRLVRVRAMQALLTELGPLAKDVSEVNAESVQNLKIITQVNGRALELVLGDGNYARRLESFLSHYPEIHKRIPGVSVFDLRLDHQITTRE